MNRWYKTHKRVLTRYFWYTKFVVWIMAHFMGTAQISKIMVIPDSTVATWRRNWDLQEKDPNKRRTKHNWKPVIPRLGKEPELLISRDTGIPISTLRRKRSRLGIAPYSGVRQRTENRIIQNEWDTPAKQEARAILRMDKDWSG